MLDTKKYIEFLTKKMDIDTIKILELFKELEQLDKSDFSLVIKEQDMIIDIVINDFDGFTDEWESIERDLTDEQSVENFIDWLEENCDSCVCDYYQTYYISGWEICVSYESANI